MGSCCFFENNIEKVSGHPIRKLECPENCDYFLASDLGVFPGRHSVLWEQAIATGLPCVFKEWKGTKHVDLGGNCKFLYNDQRDEIKKVIKEIINNEDIYNEMKQVAEDKGIEIFSYSRIAKKSINM
jgi:hypothetical protein